MEIDVLPWRYGEAVLKRNTAALIRTRNGGQCLVSSAGCVFVCHGDPVGFKSYQLRFFHHGWTFFCIFLVPDESIKERRSLVFIQCLIETLKNVFMRCDLPNVSSRVTAVTSSLYPFHNIITQTGFCVVYPQDAELSETCLAVSHIKYNSLFWRECG